MKQLAALALVIAATTTAHADDRVTALIKRQSQQFSDASAAGDGKTLAKLADDNIVFMNESGDVATKADLAGSTPPPGGSTTKLVQTDVVVKLHGDVAVTSFTDESTVAFHGQTLHAKYRSIEVWMKKPAGWLMISSQTIAVNEDPPAVKLPGKLVQDYVGTYKAGDDLVFEIARHGDELTGSVNGATPYPIKAEVADVLFTPGQPRTRRIIQRDASGKVTGVLVRREGHDLVLKRVG